MIAMKLARGFFPIFLVLLVAGFTAGGRVVTVTSVLPETASTPNLTIFPTTIRTLEPLSTNTPSPISLKNLDLNQVFDEFGELPSGLMFGDRFSEISPMFDNGPVPIDTLSQLIQSKNFQSGIISVFLFEEDDIESAFSLIVQSTLVTEEQEIVIGNQIGKFGPVEDPKLGERSAASYFEEYVDGNLIKKSFGTVIQICNVVVSATLSNTNLLENVVFDYMQGVIEIIEKIICNI